MSNTDEDRKLINELYLTLDWWRREGEIEYTNSPTILAGRLRALFASPRQVTEAEIEAAAKAAYEASSPFKWRSLGLGDQCRYEVEMRAAFAAIGLYTPPPKQTPSQKFAEAVVTEDHSTPIEQRIAEHYDAAAAKAIAVMERCITITKTGLGQRTTVEEWQAALADLRCEGNK